MDKFKEILDKSIGKFTLGDLFSAIIIFVICIIAIKVLMIFVSKAVEKINAEKTLLNFIKTGIRIALYFLAVIIAADSLGIPVTSLVAVLSVAGLALSLAVQGFLSNIASGISILISKPFVVGDYVEVNGVSGTVNDISLIYTKLFTIDNKIILVPNSEVSTNKIINYTSQTERRIDLNITASYDAPLSTVKKALKQAVDAVPEFLSEPEPAIVVSAYLDSSIEYLVKVWAKTEEYWDAYFELLEQVKKYFDENGVEMTYNHLNVHFDSTPPESKNE